MAAHFCLQMPGSTMGSSEHIGANTSVFGAGPAGLWRMGLPATTPAPVATYYPPTKAKPLTDIEGRLPSIAEDPMELGHYRSRRVSRSLAKNIILWRSSSTSPIRTYHYSPPSCCERCGQVQVWCLCCDSGRPKTTLATTKNTLPKPQKSQQY